MTAATRAMTQLVGWPDLTEAQPSCGVGRALRSTTAEIVHFHSDRRVDLHLTARMIRRFEDDLRVAAAVQLVSGSHWITMSLEREADVDLLMTFVSVALQAHQRWPDAVGVPSARCNAHSCGALARANVGSG